MSRQSSLKCLLSTCGNDLFWIRQTQREHTRWRYNGRDGISNHQPHDCLLNRLFRRRSKKTSKLRVTGLSAGNSPVTGEFPTEMASNAENVSIWWRHHAENGRLDVGASGCATNIELNTVNVLSEGHSAPTWVRVVGVTWCSSQHIMGIPLESLFNIS